MIVDSDDMRVGGGWVGRWVVGWVGGWVGRWVDGWVGGRKGGWWVGGGGRVRRDRQDTHLNTNTAS